MRIISRNHNCIDIAEWEKQLFSANPARRRVIKLCFDAIIPYDKKRVSPHPLMNGTALIVGLVALGAIIYLVSQKDFFSFQTKILFSGAIAHLAFSLLWGLHAIIRKNQIKRADKLLFIAYSRAYIEKDLSPDKLSEMPHLLEAQSLLKTQVSQTFFDTALRIKENSNPKAPGSARYQAMMAKHDKYKALLEEYAMT